MAEKILVVDDEKDICRVLGKILELSGYEVLMATSGVEALNVVKETSPDLVFLDYMMPDLTGLDVLRGIKSYSEDIYVVMVTGRGSEEVAASVMKAGASDYIIKPFDKDRILGVAKDTLRIRKAELDAKGLRAEIEEFNRELEDKVAERTRDLVETQEKLVRQQNMASLGEMSGGMAHEIRNPLNSISLYAQLILDELDKDDPRVEYAQRIMGDVDRINAIVTNLNLFSRRISREKRPFRLCDPLRSVIRTLSTQFEAKGVRVKLDVAEDMPEVLASPEEMEEVFSHLLINSMHAMPDGGEIRVGIRLITGHGEEAVPGRAAADRSYVEVSVEDTGVGIPPENLGRIFVPFFTTKSDWQGTGLGLSVVHRVVTDAHGSMDVKSELGKGARFTIRIPALEAGAGFMEARAAQAG